MKQKLLPMPLLIVLFVAVIGIIVINFPESQPEGVNIEGLIEPQVNFPKPKPALPVVNIPDPHPKSWLSSSLASYSQSNYILNQKTLPDGTLAQVLHTAGRGSIPPVRTHQIVKLDSNGNPSIISSSKMAANRFYVRSNDIDMIPTEWHITLTLGQTGIPGWVRVGFSYESGVDHLSEWMTEFVKAGFLVEPDFMVEATSMVPNDPELQGNRQPHLQAIAQNPDGSLGLGVLWAQQTDTSTVPVAVLDTGIRTTHVEFSNRLFLNLNEIPDTGWDNDGNGYIDDYFGYNFAEGNANIEDRNGHGTHLAGLIGAAGNNSKGITGVSWNASLLPVKVLNDTATGFIGDVANGIDYAIARGAKVLLLAWQTNDDSLILREALQRAEDANVVWVVAAGNESLPLDAYPRYPAVYDFANQVTVGSHNLDGTFSSFSNFRCGFVDLSAPGNDLLSIGIDNDNAYERRTGTSQSAALAAGLLAHIRSAYPEEPGWRAVQRLKASATSRNSLVTAGRLHTQPSALLAPQTRPGNDIFTNAWRTDRPHFIRRQFLTDASTASGEPNHAGLPARASVWYEWNPLESGQTKIGVDDDSVRIAVYQRAPSFAAMQSMVSADAMEGGASVTFDAEGGIAYYIVLDAPPGHPDRVALQLRQSQLNHSPSSAVSLDARGFFSSSASVRGFLPNEVNAAEAIETAWYRATGKDGIFRLRLFADFNFNFAVIPILEDENLGTALVEVSGSAHLPIEDLMIELEDGLEYMFVWQSQNCLGGYFNFSGYFHYGAPEHVSLQVWSSNWFGTDMRIVADVSGGSMPFNYEWRKDGQLLEQFTDATLRIPSLDLADSGQYSVRVWNEFGEAISALRTVNVLVGKPKIRLSPGNIKVAAGSSVLVHAEVTNSPIGNHLEWFLNGQMIQASSSRQLTLSNLSPEDSGILRAKVTNPLYSTWSQEVVIQVLDISDNSLGDWIKVTPAHLLTNQLNSAFYVNERFFVTNNNTKQLFSSPDGENWNETVIPNPLDSITGIAYGNGRYVAVGNRGTRGSMLVSEDGVFWSEGMTVPEYTGHDAFSSVAFGNGVFLAIQERTYFPPGETRQVTTTDAYTSTDGINWSKQELSIRLGLLHFGNGRFLSSYMNFHFVSTNGTDWVAQHVPDGMAERTGSITFHDGWFYKLSGVSPAMGLHRSTDGFNWEVISPSGSKAPDTRGLHYDGSHFMIPNVVNLRISENGQQFINHTFNRSGVSESIQLAGMAVGAGKIVAVLNTGRVITAETAPDLIYEQIAMTQTIARMEAFDAAIVGIGNSSGSSPKGITWSYDGDNWEFDLNTSFTHITSWGVNFIAAGKPTGNSSDQLHLTSDFKNWTPVTGLSEPVELVASGNGRIVALLKTKGLRSSEDLMFWSETVFPVPPSASIYNLRFSENSFWLLTNQGAYQSFDGSTWILRFDTPAIDIVFTEGYYYLSASNQIYRSSNGSTWALVNTDGNGGGLRMATDGSRILTSSFTYSEDQTDWIRLFPSNVSDVAFFQGNLFYSTTHGMIHRNGLATPAPQIDFNPAAWANSVGIPEPGKPVVMPFFVSTFGGQNYHASLYVNNELVDSASNGSQLSWIPTAGEQQTVFLMVRDENGKEARTDTMSVHLPEYSMHYATAPTQGIFTGLVSDRQSLWASTEYGIFTQRTGQSDWRSMEVPPVERFNGLYRDEVTGYLYAFGAVKDIFGIQRGFVVKSNNGITWELDGELLPEPVISFASSNNVIYVVTREIGTNTNSLRSRLHIKSGAGRWLLIESAENPIALQKWQNQIYTRDRSGNVLRLEPSAEWSLVYSNASTDTRSYQLKASSFGLYLAGTGDTFQTLGHDGNWTHQFGLHGLIISDGIPYFRNSSGQNLRQQPDGSFVPASLFTTTGGSVMQNVVVDDKNYYLTTDGFVRLDGTSLREPLSDETFRASLPIKRVGETLLTFNAAGKLTFSGVDTDWFSLSLDNLITAQSITAIARGSSYVLVLGSNGVHRHHANDDSWHLLPETSWANQLAYSEGRFWLGGNGELAFSDDGGETWTSIHAMLSDMVGGSLNMRQITANGTSVAVYALNRDILLSLDNGLTWVNTGRRATRLLIHSSDFYLMGDTFALRTSDGVVFENITNSLRAEANRNFSSSYKLTDFVSLNGVDFLLIQEPTEVVSYVRLPDSNWKKVRSKTTGTNGSPVLIADLLDAYLYDGRDLWRFALNDIEVQLKVLEASQSLGVGDLISSTITLTNQGHGAAAARDKLSVYGYLVPEDDPSTEIFLGNATMGMESLGEGESASITFNWSVPDLINPGSYQMRVFVQGLRDSRYWNNHSQDFSHLFNIEAVPLTVTVFGSGQGSVQIMDEREHYPKNIAVPIRVQPAAGHVAVVEKNVSGAITSANLTTISLQEGTDLRVYFEPSFETWVSHYFQDPSHRFRTTDGDGDGNANIFQYLFGHTPFAANRTANITLKPGSGDQSIQARFGLIRGRVHESFEIEISPNLMDWQTVPANVFEEGEILSFEVDFPENWFTNGFIRLKATER
jgi:hypothetical protein